MSRRTTSSTNGKNEMKKRCCLKKDEFETESDIDMQWIRFEFALNWIWIEFGLNQKCNIKLN